MTMLRLCFICKDVCLPVPDFSVRKVLRSLGLMRFFGIKCFGRDMKSSGELEELF